MSIKTEYRMHFESEDDSAESSLEISASGDDDNFRVYLARPDQAGGTDWIISMTGQEALELKALLGVLTDTASHEEEVTAGVAS
jgi:hypothetical protein